MTCVVWNARGLGNQRAFRNLQRLIVESNPSLVFLCETKLLASQCRFWKNRLNFDGCFNVDCDRRSGGLVLL